MIARQPSNIALLAELPGLEAAKQAIDIRIAEIRRLVYGEEPIEQRQIRRRTISEETREQRRHFLAKARAAKLKRLSDKKASLGAAVQEAGISTVIPEHHDRAAHTVAKPVPNTAGKTIPKRK